MQFANLIPLAAEIRAVFACLLCCGLGLLFGNRAITWLKNHFREPIKSISPTVVRLHQHKAATPTMGGLFIVAGVGLGTLIFADLRETRIWIALLTMAGFATVGIIDDLVKLRTTRRGISARTKLVGQFAVSALAATLLWMIDPQPVCIIPVMAFVIVTASNGVNLTDGLDGLAGGCSLIAAVVMGSVLFATDAKELSVVAGALVGSIAAFLWFNRHPAKVFMGDTGSQPIGALLALFAITAKQQWLLTIVGGVFVAELASVVIQLASYRFRGKRIFLCAPLHHHFQFLGWHEPKIVRRFWLASCGCAVAGLAIHQATSPTVTLEKSHGRDGNLAATSSVQFVSGESAAPMSVAALSYEKEN